MNNHSQSRFIPLPPELSDDPLGKLILRFSDQLSRLDKLGDFTHSKVKDPEIRDEIFRAIIVFTHAILEDAVREAVRRRWRDWPDEALEKLSYPGDRSNKATPLELKAFNNLTVEQLLEKLAHEWLDKKSISSTKELCSLLRLIGIDAEQYLLPTQQHFPYMTLGELQRFFERRHNIVHNGDYNRIGKHRNPIDIDTISKWSQLMMSIVADVLHAECLKHPQAAALDLTLESVFAELFRLDR